MSAHRVRMILIASIFALAPILASTVKAQGDTPSVSLKVSPSVLAPGGTVKISGNCYPQAGMQVIVTVSDPAGHAQTSTLTPKESSDSCAYSVKGGYHGTQQVGAYRVSAAASIGGKVAAPAIAQFQVTPFTTVAPNIAATEQRLLAQVPAMVAASRSAVNSLQTSPERTKILSSLDAIKQQIAQLPAAQSAQFGQMLDPITNMVSKRPDTGPVLQPLLDSLTQWANTSATAATAIDAQIKQNPAAMATCDRIDFAERTLKAAGTQLQTVAQPFDQIVTFIQHAASPLGEPSIPDWTRNTPAYRYVVDQAKADAVPFAQTRQKSEDAFTTAGKAISAPAVSFDPLFDRYCGLMSGPFTATMSAHFFTKDGKVDWWDFDTAIAGTVMLHYPRVAAGKPASVSGEFVGNATHFGFHEDLFNSDLFGKFAKGGMVGVKNIPPVPVAGQGGPTSFDIPVRGKLYPDHLTFKLGDSISDFNADYTRTRIFYVVISPLTLMLPITGHSSLPYMNAHFILQHHDFTYPLVPGSKAYVIDKTDDTDFPRPGNKAHYTLHIQLCAPKCASGQPVPNAPPGTSQ